MMWTDNDAQSVYHGTGGSVEAIVEPMQGHDWHWKVGVLQNGRTEWSLGGAAETRQKAVDAAKAMISLMESSFKTGGVVPCGW